MTKTCACFRRGPDNNCREGMRMYALVLHYYEQIESKGFPLRSVTEREAVHENYERARQDYIGHIEEER